ncbi:MULTISPECIES: cytochrome P450 [unclassified Streptomyces]|uniref:cytochrome P450 n=1 Tax=unclassified Streptomyces TaxID=2593676 RepID=UPI0008988EBF|nr:MULTISPECIES: cytochrome P450 [unclassified Streptomyces]SEF10144.1 Cytochrome P450 [Streptomyces sp. 2112.2]
MPQQMSNVLPNVPHPPWAPGPEVVQPPTVEPDGGATLLAWMRRMRNESPVWRDESGNAHVFRHADVVHILGDPGLYSSDTVGRLGGETPSGVLLLLDPPQHGKLRRLVSRAFTSRLISELTPQITTLTRELLDAVDGERFDLVDAVANPLPVMVIATMLGVPLHDQAMFQAWGAQLLATDAADPESVRRMELTGKEISAYLQEFVDARRRTPHDDLIGTLVHAEVDGQRLSDDEIVSFATLLLLAGHITTSVLLGNILLCLDSAPERWEALRADRSGIPALIEETLRCRPPFTRVERVPTREVEIAGEVIAPNTLIHLWLLSANHDERVFEDPAAFVPERSNSRQAAFGHGIHYCIGAPLARLESRIVLELMLDRFRSVRVDAGSPLSFHGSNVFGAEQLPLVVRRA